MKKYLYLLFATLIAVGLNACSPDDNEPDNPQTETPETPDNPNPAPTGKTLIVYYDLQTQIEADVVRVEPTEKGIDYAANNYAIGSALIQAIRDNPNDANSYPSIETTIDNLSDYDRIIIGAPL